MKSNYEAVNGFTLKGNNFVNLHLIFKTNACRRTGVLRNDTSVIPFNTFSTGGTNVRLWVFL